MYDIPRVPEIAERLPVGVTQMHSRCFRNAGQFPSDKAMMVVGGGQSGCQIAELLAAAGKKVYLCSSKLPGIMRSYRGHDIFIYLEMMGMLDMTNEAREKAFPPEKSEAMKYSKLPIVGSTKSISPFSLHRQGVVILGGLKNITEVCFEMFPNRAENVQASLDGYHLYRGIFSGWLEKQANRDEYPLETPDEAWIDTVPELLQESGRLTVSLDEVQGIVWATGYKTDYSWIRIPEATADIDPKRNAPGVLSRKKSKDFIIQDSLGCERRNREISLALMATMRSSPV